MQRRPSHPHAQLTGMIAIAALMLSVGIMFWMPSAALISPPAMAAGITPTPGLPSALSPHADHSPSANMALAPTMDWGTVPTAVPADQLVQPTPVPVQVIYHPADPVVVYQQDDTAVQAAQAAQAAAEQQARDLAAAVQAQQATALENQRQADERLADALVIARSAPVAVNPSDFTAPDPNASCQFTGCLHQP